MVFIANTTLQTVSDGEGKFEINQLPSGFNKIVVNKVGYKSYKANIGISSVLNVQLRTDALQLVPVKEDKKWKRLYTRFEKAFLGITVNAKRSKILNPWVIKLNSDPNGKISAYSVDLIQIENQATGYVINYLLDKAEILNGQIDYSGKALFTEFEAKDANEATPLGKSTTKNIFRLTTTLFKSIG